MASWRSGGLSQRQSTPQSNLRSGPPRPSAGRAALAGHIGLAFLTQAPCVYVCLSCRTHLSAHDSIISKAFQGRHGRAYLFADVVNINSGPTENRLLLTGLHVVADIYCNACDTRLGWKYVEALPLTRTLTFSTTHHSLLTTYYYSLGTSRPSRRARSTRRAASSSRRS